MSILFSPLGQRSCKIFVAPQRISVQFRLYSTTIASHPSSGFIFSDKPSSILRSLVPWISSTIAVPTSYSTSPAIPLTSRLSLRSVTTMAGNTVGETRPKRKQSPISFVDRPPKHLRPEGSAHTPGDLTPQNGTVYNVEKTMDSAPILNPLSVPADSPEWQATIENVVKSVVSIHFCQTCSFDTDLSLSSQATGFVVDAERGYIMTNRHVACAGPFWGYCIFDNHEEVSLLQFLCWPTSEI